MSFSKFMWLETSPLSSLRILLLCPFGANLPSPQGHIYPLSASSWHFSRNFTWMESWHRSFVSTVWCFWGLPCCCMSQFILVFTVGSIMCVNALVIYSPVDGHFGCFRFWAVGNRAAVDMTRLCVDMAFHFTSVHAYEQSCWFAWFHLGQGSSLTLFQSSGTSCIPIAVWDTFFTTFEIVSPSGWSLSNTCAVKSHFDFSLILNLNINYAEFLSM